MFTYKSPPRNVKFWDIKVYIFSHCFKEEPIGKGFKHIEMKHFFWDSFNPITDGSKFCPVSFQN